MDPPLRKALGQHHLRHPGLCAPLVAFLDPQSRRVVEIGAGGGVLTTALVDRGARVLAIERDPLWAFRLRRLLPSVALWVGDALDIRWDRLPAGSCVAGNLPYRISTALIEAVLPHRRSVERAAFLVQLEVAQRLIALPGDAAYGSFSVLVGAASRAALLGRVRPGSFRPPPKVESAFVGLELQPLPVPQDQWPSFKRLVRLAFAQRRKTLLNALGSAWGKERSGLVLERAGLDRGLRAERLGVREFVSLFRAATRERDTKPCKC